jgi:hypothetical protein
LCHFKFLTMINTIVGAGAVGAGAGAASRYGSGSDQNMRLLAAPAPQHWFLPPFRYTCLWGKLESIPELLSYSQMPCLRQLSHHIKNKQQLTSG